MENKKYDQFLNFQQNNNKMNYFITQEQKIPEETETPFLNQFINENENKQNKVANQPEKLDFLGAEEDKPKNSFSDFDFQNLGTQKV